MMTRGRVALAITVLAVVAVCAGTVAAGGAHGGPLLRVVAVGPAPNALAVDARTGRVFVTDAVEGSVRVLDASSGAVVRTVALGRGGPLAVSEQLGRVFVAGAWNGPDKHGVYGDHATVTMLDARTGGVLRTVSLGVPDDAVALAVEPSPASSRGGRPDARIDVVFSDTLRVLDARSGAALRTLAVGHGPHLIATDAETGRAFVVNGADNSVSVLDTRGGSVVRTVRVGEGPSALEVDERAAHVVVAAARTVTMLDARSGAPLRTVAVRHASGALAVDTQTGRAFLASADGAVRVLDTRSGAILRSIPVSGKPVAVAVDESSGRVFVGSQGPYTRREPMGTGTVRVLDARSGAALYTLPVGDVVAVAADALAGRAFVVDSDDRGVKPPDAWAWLPPWLRGHLPWVPHPPPPSRGGSGTVSIVDATR